MRKLEAAEVREALLAAGIHSGDGLLLHSAIQYLGHPSGGIGIYYRALWSVLEGEPLPQDDGYALPAMQTSTLAAPAFNFAFARGEAYDPTSTPAAGMGALSEYLRRHPQALRTPHPMQSLVVLGRHAADLAGRDTPSAFDPGSAFERLLELDFKLLLLGASIQAVSMLHYSEQHLGVPYRYWKDFSAPYLTTSGWQTRTYRMYVRDLDLDPHIELFPVQAALEERRLWRSVPLNYGALSVCRLADFVAVLEEFLSSDPWSLVSNAPGSAGHLPARTN